VLQNLIRSDRREVNTFYAVKSAIIVSRLLHWLYCCCPCSIQNFRCSRCRRP